MTICFFGYPNQQYSRYQILINGLSQHSVKVIACTELGGLFFIRAWRLLKKFYHLRTRVDLIFVPYPGQLNMPIAWLVGKLFRKPVFFDAFVSLHDTYVFDRQIARPASLKAAFYWWLDKLACSLADVVTLDTNAHIRHFVRKFRLSRKKFQRLPVGGDDVLFKPRQQTGRRRKIIIEFHGMFTRLHGAEIFVKTAKALEKRRDLEFWLIGDSWNWRLPIELYQSLRPKTMKYFPRLPENQLAVKVAQADISVGHLGPTQKARIVVTNKMFQALASQTALLAGDNPASREFFTDRKNCLFVKMYDAKDLAKKILLLVANKRLRQTLARNGYRLHQQRFTNSLLASKLLQIIRHHLGHIS